MSGPFVAFPRTSTLFTEHVECQEAGSQNRLNSKGLRDGESHRYLLRVESMTSSRKKDRRGARAQFHHAFNWEAETSREDYFPESTRLVLNQAATAPFLLCAIR